MEIKDLANEILRKYSDSKIDQLSATTAVINFDSFELIISASRTYFLIEVAIFTTVSFNQDKWSLSLRSSLDKTDSSILTKIDQAIKFIQGILLADRI